MRTFLIVTAIILVAAVGIYSSDVWRTRIHETKKQFQEWTPENIAKDPENYLNFCEQQLNSALTDLKAREISIAQSRGTINNMLDDAKQKIALGTTVLAQLKDAFTKADSAHVWPVAWEGQDRSEDWIKQNIFQLHKEIDTKRALQTKLQGAIKQLDAQEVHAVEVRQQALSQLAQVKTDREIVKINKISDDLAKQWAARNPILEPLVHDASGKSEMIQLDDLPAQHPGVAFDDGQFKKIMAEK